MPNPPNWLIIKYWIKYNPATQRGQFWLNMDNDPEPEITKDNLSAQDTAAIAAILARGGARYFADGSIGIEV